MKMKFGFIGRESEKRNSSSQGRQPFRQNAEPNIQRLSIRKEPIDSYSGGPTLEKREILDIRKEAPKLNSCAFTVSWLSAPPVPGESYVERERKKIDLDIMALLLDENMRLNDIEKDLVWYNSKAQNGIALDRDEQEGNAVGDADCERINISLSHIDWCVKSILFIVSVNNTDYDYVDDWKCFGMARNSFIRFLDTDGRREKELCRFALDSSFSTDTIMCAARLFRQNGGWTFQSIGEGVEAATILTFITKYSNKKYKEFGEYKVQGNTYDQNNIQMKINKDRERERRLAEFINKEILF